MAAYRVRDVTPDEMTTTSEVGVLSLANMSPDFNNDGVVDATEAAVFKKMKDADVDGDGFLTRAEIYGVIASSHSALEEAKKGGISITSLNPDSDGDGKVEKWEVEVFERIKDADADESGSISVKELFSVIKGAAESDRQKRRFRRAFFAALIVILALVGAMLGMGIVSGEAIKESHVPDCSDPAATGADPRCSAGSDALVRVGGVESFASIFDLPLAPTEQLAYLRDVTLYIDMTAAASVGGAVEATFKLAGAYKRSADHCTLLTTNGYAIALNASSRTGTVAMDGASYPVAEGEPVESGGRRLETEGTPMLPTLSAKQLAHSHYEMRKLFAYGGALMTSGSFTMMASTGMF